MQIKYVAGACCQLALLTGIAKASQPNVILILADDLGYGGLHCYGTDYVETPNLDKLCSQGMKFTQGYAAYPTCRPSRAAIISGQYGPRTGIYRVCDSYGDEDKARWIIPKNHQLAPQKFTIGKAFKQAGYTTAVYGKWHVSNTRKSHPKDDFGFDVAYTSHGAHYNAKSLPEVELPKGMMIEELYTKMASDFMEQSVKDDKPFFLFMPYFLIHAPFEAPQADIDYFRKKLAGRSDILASKRGGKKKKNSHAGDLATVLAMTRLLDEYAGRLLKKVDELGISDDTVILFASDNGAYERNLVGGYRGRKGDTYDGGMRVPYIFKWSGKIKSGSVSDARIIGVDIYPTLLGLAGIKPPVPDVYPLDGVDLSPLLLGRQKKLAPRRIYCCYPKYARYHNGRWANSWRNVVFDGDYKLIEYPEYGDYEMFNLAQDAKETTNLADCSPEKCQALKTELHDWLKAVGAPPLEPNPAYKKEAVPAGGKKRRSFRP